MSDFEFIVAYMVWNAAIHAELSEEFWDARSDYHMWFSTYAIERFKEE